MIAHQRWGLKVIGIDHAYMPTGERRWTTCSEAHSSWMRGVCDSPEEVQETSRMLHVKFEMPVI